MDILNSIRTIKYNQKTIEDLLMSGSMKFPTLGLGQEKGWVLNPLHADSNCSVGIVVVDSVEDGPCGEHVHADSIEYLIVTYGSIVLNLNGRDVREVRAGECASIPKGMRHYCTPLSKTSYIYICVPADPGIPNTGEMTGGL